jgi:hypothetical protein
VGLIGGVNPTWLTSQTDWIPPEFGSTWLVKVYAGPPSAANIQATGTQLFATGSGGTGEYFFDNQAGLLNFIGNTIPASLTSGNVIYVSGYRYVGLTGTTNLPGNTTIGNLFFDGTTITSEVANGNITLTADGTGNVAVTGNISAQYLYGNGSQLTGINASGGVVQSNVAPTSPTSSTLWWDEVSGTLYVWYDDGVCTQWVAAAPSAGGTGSGSIIQSATAPADPTSSTLWWDEVSGTLYVWYDDGVCTQWVAAAPSAGISTGNVTFNNINVIGDGNLHLQPDPANAGSYLDIYLKFCKFL